VGGIALVFDSEPQFKAMLKDSEPNYLVRLIQQQSFSLIVHPNGSVISSTNDELAPGLVIKLPKKLTDCNAGDSGELPWLFNNKKYIVGYAMTAGYREYKNTDGYTNPLLSLTFTPI
jgi:hypothetical protein